MKNNGKNVTTNQKSAFTVGSRVLQRYISDNNPHNNMPATITWMHEYNYYPEGNPAKVEKRAQASLLYDNGDTVGVGDLYMEGCGILSRFELIE